MAYPLPGPREQRAPAYVDGLGLLAQEETLVMGLRHRALPAEDVGELTGGTLGEKVTRRFLELCEHPRTRVRTTRMLRSSADSAVGGRLLVAFVSRMVFTPLLRSRRIDHMTARIELACAQLGGVAVLRYVTRMEPVASMSVDDLVAMVGPSVHITLTSPYARPH